MSACVWRGRRAESFARFQRKPREHGLVEAQHAGIALAELIVGRVVARPVARGFLVGDQVRHAFEHEVEVVRPDERHVNLREGTKAGERRQRPVRERHDVWTTAREEPGDPSAADVDRPGRDVTVELVLVRPDVRERPAHAELLAVPEHEAERARRLQAEPRHLPRQVDDERAVGAVVERAGAEIPRVEMRAPQHDLVRRRWCRGSRRRRCRHRRSWTHRRRDSA